MNTMQLSARTCTFGRPLAARRSLPASTSGRGQLVVRAATAVPSQYKNVSPIGDRVFVKVDVSEAKSVGGILLPSSAQTKPTQGDVVQAGSAKAVKAGDKVVYSKYAGTEIELQGAEHVLLKEDDVIGVLRSDNIAELKPLGDRILIEVAEAEETTQGGLLLTNAGKDKPTLGKVVAVGSGKTDDKGTVVKPNLEVGNTVMYSKYSGTEFEGPGEKQYIVVREMDVLAVLA
ncbi:hypothetical protein WJX72_009164 [[Myrmecia] bisecta]|uniref:20 kDa chaperonin, chloroplastic n=1 Tax=[Myrmecia] bisecta TaxID=41462 RepID=A0AAW1R8Q3_9CHLO